jgi:nitroreductase
MQTNTSWIQSIRDRISVRTYDDMRIDQELINKLNTFINDINKNVEEKMRFQIISNSERSTQESIKLGTYGVIKGTNTFIAGIIKQNGHEIELGYEMEKFVLYATSLSLGTCWLGGTYNRKDFENHLSLNDNESLVILIAIGYKKDKLSMMDSAVRFVAKSNQRKPWEELFFNESIDNTLNKELIGDYSTVLELVRIAPSASNKQPWRIIKRDKYYDLYLCRTPGYGILGYDIQLNDIGIAKYHFECVALGMNLKGKWSITDSKQILNWEYCISWETID